MITTPIFTRILSTSDYGKLGAFDSWYGVISIIAALAMSGGVHVHGIVKFIDEKNVFSSSLQGLTTFLVIIWVSIYFCFREFWNSITELSTIQTVSMFLIIWINAVFGFWANEQRNENLYKSLVVVTFISSIVKPTLEILLVINASDKVTAKIVGWVIADLLVFGWLSIVQMKKGGVFYSKKFWFYALTFNIPLIPHYLSQTVLNSADRIMIKKMIGPSEAGIYTLAYSVAIIMMMFNTALGQTISPWAYKNISLKKGKEIAPIAYITLILIAYVNLIFMVFAPDLVRIFAPPDYYEAIWVIPPITMSVFFIYSYDLFAKFAFFYGKTLLIMIASVISALLNIFLNYIFIRKYGYFAAGYTTLICYIAYSVAHYIIMRKVCEKYCNALYPYETRRILLISISFICMGFIVMSTYAYSFIRYCLMVIMILLAFIFRKYLFNKFIQIKQSCLSEIT